MENNTYRKEEVDRRIYNLEKQMTFVSTHISDTNLEMGKIKTNVDWLCKFFWVIAAASIGGLITTVINLLIQLKL